MMALHLSKLHPADDEEVRGAYDDGQEDVGDDVAARVVPVKESAVATHRGEQETF